MDQRIEIEIQSRNQRKSVVQLAINKLTFSVSIFTILCAFSSCHLLKKNEDKGEIVARVNEHILYAQDVPVIITSGLAPDDSIRLLKSYVEGWVKEMVLVTKAEQNLSPEMLDFEERIRTYKNSLVVFEYERALVEERLDTSIASYEISDYWSNNKPDFVLQEPAFRFYYMGIQEGVHDKNKVINSMRSNNPVKMEELKAYGLGYGAKFIFEDENWIKQSDIQQIIGARFSEDLLESSNPLKILNENGLTHYLLILESKKAGQVAPLLLVKGEIRSKIINDRKFKLVNTMRTDLFNEALNNKDAEIYF